MEETVKKTEKKKAAKGEKMWAREKRKRKEGVSRKRKRK